MKRLETPIAMRYNPKKDGLERWLGSLETRVMRAIWSLGAGSWSVKRVYRELLVEQQLDYGYSTIMTTMVRLSQKEMLTRMRRLGDRTYYYTARDVDEDAFIEQQLRLLVQSLELADSELVVYNRAAA